MTRRRPARPERPRTKPRKAAAAQGKKLPAPTVPARRRWSEEDRQTALAQIAAEGIAATHRATRIPKGTLSGWAKKAAVIPGGDGTDAAKTARATEAAAATLARAREQLTVAQSQIALTASALELEVLQAQMAIVEHARANPGGVLPVELTGRLSAALGGPRLPDIVGSRTRAIHDLQLLEGRPTEGQPEGGLVVVFATSSPAAAGRRGAPKVYDLPADQVREVEG